jgi:hypothetical protein
MTIVFINNYLALQVVPRERMKRKATSTEDTRWAPEVCGGQGALGGGGGYSFHTEIQASARADEILTMADHTTGRLPPLREDRLCQNSQDWQLHPPEHFLQANLPLYNNWI